ncbi:ribonucleotide reductase [Auricularia subglabra TFB-10046 SS5]|uniref:Ribonucleotide reductase n=1 Tax=Auricularia subglabra (strain TFB-10046 / SS5) TaxID=717982 RepID=J0WP91_AURST|nr:ribonucleotide reductase [Auricularia subglabra TFB-10046 SS5]
MSAGQSTFFDDTYEPVLLPTHYRLVLYPINFVELWVLYKKAVSFFWSVGDLDFNADVQHWDNKLNMNERHFVSHILALIASSKGVIYENIVRRFACELQIAEARCFLGIQAAVQNTHLEAASLMAHILVRDPIQHQYVFNALDGAPCVQRRAAWIARWLDNDDLPFRMRVVALAVVGGVFFSGAFASLFWLEERGLLPAVAMLVRFISRDERLHSEFACALFDELRLRPCVHVVHRIIGEAVEVEKGLLTESLPVSLVGLDVKEMGQYIEHVADRLLQRLGYAALYHAFNPFAFADFAIAGQRDEFFQRSSGTYGL